MDGKHRSPTQEKNTNYFEGKPTSQDKNAYEKIN